MSSGMRAGGPERGGRFDDEPFVMLDRLSVGYPGSAGSGTAASPRGGPGRADAGAAVPGAARASSARVVLAEISETVHEGELICLLGPNGSGKSTLLKSIAGFLQPLAGELRIGGRATRELTFRERAREVSVVLTDRVDSGLLTGEELVALGRYPHTGWNGRLSEQDRRAIARALELVRAGDLAGRAVSSVSDGERQRIMIARALAQEPRLLLLDEPTAFLDLSRKVEIMALLRRLAREEGRAVLLSTHELELALQVADRIWLIGRDGALHAGAPEDLILLGAFARSFSGEGLRFDPERGSFQVLKERGRAIRLIGEGTARHWTERALEREGFAAVEDERPPLVVRVEGGEGAYRWTVEHAGGRETFGSVQGLLRALRSMGRPS